MKCENKTTTVYIRSRDNMSPQIELAFCDRHDPGKVAASARMDRGEATTTYVDGARVDGIPTWPNRPCDHR